MSRPVPDEVLLGLLTAQPSYGYDLLERFRSNKHLGRIWHLSTSQMYAVLKRLEEKGAIRGNDIEVEDAPSRREYHVLPAGQVQLDRWLYTQEPSASLHRIRVFFLSRLYIAAILNRSITEIVHNQIKVCKLQRQEFEKEQLKTGSDIESLTLGLVINQLTSVIAWIENYQKIFTKISINDE